MSKQLVIHLFSFGNPQDVNTWSGVPYYIGLGSKQNNVNLIYSDLSFPKLSNVYNSAVSLLNRITRRLFQKKLFNSFHYSLFSCCLTNAYIFLRTVRYYHSDINLFFTFTYGWSAFPDRTVLLCDQTYSDAISLSRLQSKDYYVPRYLIRNQLLTLKHAKYIFGTTQAVIDSLMKYDNNLSVHPTPIRFTKIHKLGDDTIQQKSTDTDGKKSIIFIGSNSFYRGLDVLLESWLVLQDTFPEFSLYIIGCDISNLDIKNKHRLKRVINYLYLDKNKKDEFLFYTQLLKNASLFVMPQRGELLAGVMMEALHFGTPVVTTDVKGMDRFIQHQYNGLLLPQAEPAVFANAIKELLRDEERLKLMSVNAVQSVEHLSPENGARELIAASLAAINRDDQTKNL